jgi:hypothetical protein
MALSIVRCLACNSTYLEWPLEEMTWLFNWLDAFIAEAMHVGEWPLITWGYYKFGGYEGVAIVLVTSKGGGICGMVVYVKARTNHCVTICFGSISQARSTFVYWFD